MKRKRKYVKTWIFTNRNLETFRFGLTSKGDIHTLKFLGWKTSKGKIIKPMRLKDLGRD